MDLFSIFLSIITNIHVLLIFFSSFAFLVCLYIFISIQTKQAVTLFGNPDCNEVIHSHYGNVFGIGVEVMGMTFFAITYMFSAIALNAPSIKTPETLLVMFALALLGFYFALYLFIIQFFSLRKLCFWCIMLFGIIALVMVMIGFIGFGDILTLLPKYYSVFLGMHIVAITIGYGGAIFNDMFFFIFLRDFRISEIEKNIMSTFSKGIWIALMLFFASGLALFLPQAESMLANSKFLLKMTAVGVIVLNGIALNLYVAPRLLNLSFWDNSSGGTHLRKTAFALGAISFTSWNIAFLMGLISSLPFSFIQLLLFYVVALIGAILGSQVLEYIIEIKASKHFPGDTAPPTLPQ